MAMGAQWTNLMNFLIYLGISLLLMGLGLWVFMLITSYKEFKMIGEGGTEINGKAASATAAAYTLGGKILGLALVLASAVFHSVNPFDLILWGLIGIGFQILICYLYELVTPFKVSAEISKGNVAAGVLSAFISVSSGLLLAALISY